MVHRDSEAEILEAARPSLVSLAWMMLGDKHSAEDAVHDGFAAVARRGLEGIEHPRAYLRTVVVNECRRHLRRRSNASASATQPGIYFDRHDVELLDLLHALSSRQRAVVILRYYEDLEVNEIARLLECPPATVSSLLRRALQSMRKDLSSD